MMRIIGFLSLVAFLASCGADGMPTKPEPKTETVEEVDVAVVAA
jgi:hypothetical protein